MSPDDKRKWRLSNLLSPGHKDSNSAPAAKESSNTLHPDGTDHDPHDSAYGGSEMNSAATSDQNVPTITSSEATAQGAPVKTQTDKISGRVITTTTTTTTTTVTTLDGERYDVPAGSDVVVTKDSETITQGPTELSARPLSRERREEQQGPPIPTKNNRRSMSPRRAARTPEPAAPSPMESSGRPNFSYPARTPPPAAANTQQQSYSASQSQKSRPAQMPPSQLNQSGTPHIPHQSYAPFNPQIPARYDSATPNQQAPQYQAYNPRNPHPVPQNSSRPRPPVDPTHNQPRVDGTSQSAMSYPQQRPSTVQNLKTAAAGIHGAGEALRGTINSTVDRRLGATPAQLAAHDAVIERGRTEIETGKYQHLQRPQPVMQGEALAVPQEKDKKSRFGRNLLKKSKSNDLGLVREERV